MNLIAVAAMAVERFPLPDAVTRAGIAMLVDRTRSRLDRCDPSSEKSFAGAMGDYPIAVSPEAANAQHYELPPEFFALVLGPHRKYSCCFYDGAASLAQAEARALEITADHAGLADGQEILELGCGWGSLSLWMAEHLPNARITAVSNAHNQRQFIEAAAASAGLRNLRVITADINTFDPQQRFDRIVSVEMWEHMSNWQALLHRVRTWIQDDGRLFIHVFSHRTTPYRFETDDRADWIAQYFFTGGIMPSHGMIRHLDEDFMVEEDWRWNGQHYQRTANAWLANYDSQSGAIDAVLARTYGADAPLWKRRWRLFFQATSGLFGASNGEAWGISHYRLRPRTASVQSNR
jgi:cyclopropane-fatty-acyl-phospholipid synthase